PKSTSDSPALQDAPMTSRQRKSQAYFERAKTRAAARDVRRERGRRGAGSSEQDADTREVDSMDVEGGAVDSSQATTMAGIITQRGRGNFRAGKGGSSVGRGHPRKDEETITTPERSEIPSDFTYSRGYGRIRGRENRGGEGRGRAQGPWSSNSTHGAEDMATLSTSLASVHVSLPRQISFGRGVHRAFGTGIQHSASDNQTYRHAEWSFGKILRAHKSNRPFVVLANDGFTVLEVQPRRLGKANAGK
ncbi:hypothetical protein HDU93_000871, partial [Gonapodya sp. JEL0774]